MNGKSPRRCLGLLAGIVSGAFCGGMIYTIHLTAGQIPAAQVTFMRAFSAAVLLLPYILRHGRAWFAPTSSLLWLRSAIGSISVLCLVWNLQHTSVGFASTLLNLAPILVVLIGAFLGVERFKLGRFLNIILVVAASILFWHGSRTQAPAMVWMVGLGGMSAAAVAYAMVKILPSVWSPLDMTWCLSLAELPVTLFFKRGPWIFPTGKALWMLAAICALSLISNALTNFSFRHLELSTATALVPSCIIWGVLLDMWQGQFPLLQGVLGCLLYLFAIISLATQRNKPAIDTGNIAAPAIEEIRP